MAKTMNAVLNQYMALSGRIKKSVTILVLNTAVLLALLTIIEVGLRIAHIPYHTEWEPTENAIARFDRDLGWVYLPNLNRPVQFENNERMIYTDANGIRVPAPGYSLSASKPSVLFIGGSDTMGHGLAYQESFVGQLDAYSGNPYQMVNLGVQAYGTDQAYLSLLKFAPRFNTKYVVYTFTDEHIGRNGIYDRRLLMPTAHFLGTKPLFALSGNTGIRLVKQAVPFNEYRCSYLVDALTISLGAKTGLFPPYPEELTIRLIQHMDRYCKEHGIRFVLLNWRWNSASYNKFSKLNVDMIDTLSHAPPGWETMRIPGDVHPNAEAGTHVARLLHDYLKSR